MKSILRNALLGAAGLVALSLPAGAASPTATADNPAIKSSSTTAPMQFAQRKEDPSAGSVGFKKGKKAMGKKKKKKKS